MPYTIKSDIESLMKKIDRCSNDPEKSSATLLGRIFLVDIQCQLYGLLII